MKVIIPVLELLFLTLMPCDKMCLRIDWIRKSLEAPYRESYRVLTISSKHILINMNNVTHTQVSVDRLKL